MGSHDDDRDHESDRGDAGAGVAALRARLEAGALTADDALPALAQIARAAPVRAARLEACVLLGDLAGRAHDAAWETAEKAAHTLLELARLADAPAERRGLLQAMGHGVRNVWLLPFVHRRLADGDPAIVSAAIHAAGGLGFPALEAAVAGFLIDADGRAPTAPQLRRDALAALGRMGSMSAIDRIVPFIAGDPADAAAALTALTEIRSPAGVDAAVAAIARSPEREVAIAAVRYLAEVGAIEVLPWLRRLARDADPELRLTASLASRALKAERARDAGERFLIALTERDRAVRAVLARRLRTVAVAEVLEHAELLIGDDAAGVVQVLGELREPEVTRYLLGLARRDDLPLQVRARAVGAIEANLGWERTALVALATDDGLAAEVRAAAARAMGAFVGEGDLFGALGGLAGAADPVLRGAFLWALQLAARPGGLAEPERARCIVALRALLDDQDATVARRAAYVAGNLGLAELAPGLLALIRADRPPELRLAAWVGLGELAAAAVVAELLPVVRRELDGRVLAAASRAVTTTVLAHPGAAFDLAPLHAAIQQHLRADDALIREAAVRLAGICRGAVPAAAVAKLAGDAAPQVRAEAITALGRIGSPDGHAALLAAFDDADPAIHERAADALLAIGGRPALAQVLVFIAGEGDDAVRAAIAARLVVPAADATHVLPLVDAALERLDDADSAGEPLLALKVTLLELGRGAPTVSVAELDASIVAAFPSFAHIAKLGGFDSLTRSLRTGESLYRSTSSVPDADQSPAISLWMKCLENYVHAWLGPRLSRLQREPGALFDYVERAVIAWPTYQRYVGERWRDPVEVGAARVDVPLRALPNALREFQEHRRKRLDSPLSITEWARLMVFFAVEHPSGMRNLFQLPSGSPDATLRLAHRLHTLAAVRNLVTHRAAASAATLEAFRRGYYGAFEDLARMA